jgi:hypothetical protein
LKFIKISFLGLITAANIVIAIVLRRVSRASLDSRLSEDQERRDSDANMFHKKLSYTSTRFRPSGTSIPPKDIISATKRRTSTQVTRMLLAVTLSLIICNIPNTIFFISVKIYDTRELLYGRSCIEISDHDIYLYKFGFYSSVVQDILSDLPHIFNFFLYCLAGRKFRSIFITEVHQFLIDLRLIKRKERRFTHGAYSIKTELSTKTGFTPKQGRSPSDVPLPKSRKTVEVLFNGKTAKTFFNEENKNLLNKRNSSNRTIDELSASSYKNIQ